MRRLLYVPIVHEEADMGSVGSALARKSVTLSGQQRWATHKEIMARFWESVAAYLRSFDPCRLKVYQDGLAADGKMGRRIVEEAAARGSGNYRLILELLDKGAESRKTEDPLLLLREHENIRRATQEESAGGPPRKPRQDQQQNSRLTEERDRFIAQTINATLKDGEVGVLFIGAYHDVVSYLADDTSVEMVKEPQTVQAYFHELLQGRDDSRLQELAQHLTSPVSMPQ